MTHEKDYAKSSYFMVAGYVSAGFEFLFIIILARMLSPSLVGSITMSRTILELAIYLAVHIFSLSSLSILQTYVPHFLGKEDTKSATEIFRSSSTYILTASFIISTIAFFFSGAIASSFFKSPELDFPIKIIAIIVPIATTMGVLEMTLNSLKQFGNLAIARVIKALVCISASLLFIYLSLDASPSFIIINAMIGFLIGYLATSVYSFVKLLPFFKQMKTFKPSFKLKKKIIRFGLNNMVLSLIGMGWAYSDRLCIGYFLSEEFWGFFAVAFYFSSAIRPLSGSIGTIVFPHMASLYGKGDKHGLSSIISNTIRFNLIFILPSTIALIILARPLIFLIFGSEYEISVLPMQILMVGVLFSLFSSNIGSAITAITRPELMRTPTVVMATMNVVLNIILVQSMGIVGVAIATAVTYLSLLLWSYRIVNKEIGIEIPLKTMRICLIGTAMLGIWLYLLKSYLTSYLTGFVLVFVSAVVYLHLLVFLGEINEYYLNAIEEGLPKWMAMPFVRYGRWLMKMGGRL